MTTTKKVKFCCFHRMKRVNEKDGRRTLKSKNGDFLLFLFQLVPFFSWRQHLLLPKLLLLLLLLLFLYRICPHRSSNFLLHPHTYTESYICPPFVLCSLLCRLRQNQAASPAFSSSLSLVLFCTNLQRRRPLIRQSLKREREKRDFLRCEATAAADDETHTKERRRTKKELEYVHVCFGSVRSPVVVVARFWLVYTQAELEVTFAHGWIHVGFLGIGIFFQYRGIGVVRYWESGIPGFFGTSFLHFLFHFWHIFDKSLDEFFWRRQKLPKFGLKVPKNWSKITQKIPKNTGPFNSRYRYSPKVRDPGIPARY